jgi:phosphatidylserine/phosphatidylglycerophosphate/cardiolipin synthase-like enzyme
MTGSLMPSSSPSSPSSRRVPVTLLADEAHCTTLIPAMTGAQTSLWIATANVKELRVEAPVGTRARARGQYVSILEHLESLVERKVDVRMLHGALPSRPFRAELARRPGLAKKLPMRHCPRVHLKVVAVDGRMLYLGSANFTGAGLGAKQEGRRNFEMGIVTDDDVLLDEVQERFDRIWTGRECGSCKVRGLCPRPLDMPRPPLARTRAPRSLPLAKRA